MRAIKPQYDIHLTRSVSKRKVYKNTCGLLDDLEGAYTIIVWQHQGLYIGSIENKEISILNNSKMKCKFIKEEKYWLRARIFNEREEFYLRLENGKLISRHRIDARDNQSLESVEYITSQPILRSAIVIEQNNEIKEKIEVRNYIGYKATGDAEIIDMRFVKILNFKNHG